MIVTVFFFQAEDGIRDLVRSRGLGDVYKRQEIDIEAVAEPTLGAAQGDLQCPGSGRGRGQPQGCLLYTSDACDERSSVDLGGCRIIKKKK